MLRKEIQEKLVTNMAELTTTGRDIGEEKIFEKSFQGRGEGKANYANSENEYQNNILKAEIEAHLFGMDQFLRGNQRILDLCLEEVQDIKKDQLALYAESGAINRSDETLQKINEKIGEGRTKTVKYRMQANQHQVEELNALDARMKRAEEHLNDILETLNREIIVRGIHTTKPQKDMDDLPKPKFNGEPEPNIIYEFIPFFNEYLEKRKKNFNQSGYLLKQCLEGEALEYIITNTNHLNDPNPHTVMTLLKNKYGDYTNITTQLEYAHFAIGKPCEITKESFGEELEKLRKHLNLLRKARKLLIQKPNLMDNNGYNRKISTLVLPLVPYGLAYHQLEKTLTGTQQLDHLISTLVGIQNSLESYAMAVSQDIYTTQNQGEEAFQSVEVNSQESDEDDIYTTQNQGEETFQSFDFNSQESDEYDIYKTQNKGQEIFLNCESDDQESDDQESDN